MRPSALLIASCVFLAPLAAAEPDDSPQPAGPPAVDPDARDARGWHLPLTPMDPAALLTANPAQPLALPAEITQRVQRRTVLVYISPSCPHCVNVIPELVDLSGRIAEHTDTLAVFSGFAKRGDVESFAQQQQLPFPWVYDTDKAFAMATGLSSTPSVLVVQPGEPGAETVEVGDAYMPYVHGADAILEMRLLGDAQPVLARGAWLGPVACGGCHLEEARSHAMTLHGLAYYHLAQAGGVDQPACFACHVTNPVEPYTPGRDPVQVGFRPGDHRSPFAGVTCESCHTPSGPHDGDGGDPAASCAGCHAADHVPFDAAQGLALIDHYRGAWASDAEVQAWREAVALGDEDRPMVAMPRGASAGVKACASCHKPQARQWRKTPHAHAMDQLAAEGSDQVTCVICHATPRDSSTPVDGIEGFRTDESVGCEICHGPGAAHAADPAANPLWTLRTQEPACFVEGVCVRCHNAVRDPDFAIDPALEAVKH
jgi:hypothetical protein